MVELEFTPSLLDSRAVLLGHAVSHLQNLAVLCRFNAQCASQLPRHTFKLLASEHRYHNLKPAQTEYSGLRIVSWYIADTL